MAQEPGCAADGGGYLRGRVARGRARVRDRGFGQVLRGRGSRPIRVDGRRRLRGIRRRARPSEARDRVSASGVSGGPLVALLPGTMTVVAVELDAPESAGALVCVIEFDEDGERDPRPPDRRNLAALGRRGLHGAPGDTLAGSARTSRMRWTSFPRKCASASSASCPRSR